MNGYDSFLKGLSLKESGHGTHFYIAPAEEYIEDEIEYEVRTGEKRFTKFLIGFSNVTFSDDSDNQLKTAFRYWESDQDSEDLIEENAFFTKDDLQNSDHYFNGQFDEFGQFIGSVRVYNKRINEHVISWPPSAGKKTLCGPFSIEFGYIAGTLRESQLELNEWKPLDTKTEKIGGLYIYRNGLRILPYGLSDYDWLRLEERRSKKASYYFFL